MRSMRPSLGKTTRPSLSGILPRQRLFDFLDRARERSTVWISGPPGCGKTTLAASYLDHSRERCLWYQVDEGDAEAATFFYYLGLAVQELDPSGAPQPLLTAEYHSALGLFTRRWFQSLFARLPTPITVVLDGWHEIPAFSPVHDVLREALAELPPGVSVVVISRGAPPATLARLRANRAIAAVGWEDLRLTREEVDSIVMQRKPGIGKVVLADLYERTQGWAAGLVLMLEQDLPQGTAADGIAGMADAEAGQPVFDYLAGEIFQKSDEGTQVFLLRTAYLAQMTAGMAEQIAGDARAARILSGLHRNNYFVTLRQAGPEPVYQYHPMFREFLLARVRESWPKDRRRQLQRDSAALMDACGYGEEAVALHREGHNWEAMARAIGQQAPAMLAQGRGETLLRWIDDLPPDMRDRHPWVVYWGASSRAQLAPREGRLLHEKAFELFRASSPSDLTGMALAASGAMDAILYELDDFSLLDRWIAVLDESCRAGVRYPDRAVEARVACSMVFSLTLRQPHRRDIEQWIEQALACARETKEPNLVMFVGLLCSLTLMWTGLYTKSLELIEAMRRLSGSTGVSPFSMLTLKNVEAMHHMLTADRDACLKSMQEGLDIARATGVNTWTFQLLVYGFGGALGGQDLALARQIAPQLETGAAGAGRFNLCLYHHFRAWEAILEKDVMRALREERGALRMAVEVGCPYFEALCRLALAEILAECGDERKCIAQLQQLRPLVEAIDNRHLEFTCLMAFGRLAIEHGRQRPGLNSLRRGFALGREYGYEHFLWWRPVAMGRACTQALSAGIEPEYAKSLIRRRGLWIEPPPQAVVEWPWAFRLRTLGGFQLLRGDAPLGTEGRAQRRPLDLLKVLHAMGGERVAEERITEALWPRIDGDSAHRSFTSALHRLRKLLAEDRAVVLHEGRLTLDRRYFWTDAWAFEELVLEIEGVMRRVPSGVDTGLQERLADRMLGLYRGPFMAGEANEAWYSQPRERMRQRFVRAMTALGRRWEEGGQADRALACYERCLEAEPLSEGFYRSLMVCFGRLGRRAEAMEAYNRCRKALGSVAAEPSSETRALFEKLV
ncbi:MAG: BTAD domain-containing putative transcriptional regulator [Betaproteobacteria bacterium]